MNPAVISTSSCHSPPTSFPGQKGGLSPVDSYEKSLVGDVGGVLIARNLNKFNKSSQEKIRDASNIARYWLDGAMSVLSSREAQAPHLGRFNSKERRAEKKTLFQLYTGLNNLTDGSYNLFSLSKDPFAAKNSQIVARVDKSDPYGRIFLNSSAIEQRSAQELAVTILHELSHVICDTMDYFYVNWPEDDIYHAAKNFVDKLNSRNLIELQNDPDFALSRETFESSLNGAGCQFSSYAEIEKAWITERQIVLLSTADYVVARAMFLAAHDSIPDY